MSSYQTHGAVGEGVNTSDCGSDMRGFDLHTTPHFTNKRFISNDRLFSFNKIDKDAKIVSSLDTDEIGILKMCE